MAAPVLLPVSVADARLLPLLLTLLLLLLAVDAETERLPVLLEVAVSAARVQESEGEELSVCEPTQSSSRARRRMRALIERQK